MIGIEMLSMGLTVRVQGLLDYAENAFVREVSFLYLRYILPPAQLWLGLSPNLDYGEEFSPGADGKVVAMRDFVVALLQKQTMRLLEVRARDDGSFADYDYDVT